jgi:Concanavalin A-like lectin/glucanases superfamily
MAIGHDGVDDAINAASLVASVTAVPFTIASWFNVNTIASEQSIIGASGGGGDYHVVNLLGNVTNDPVGARSLNSGINSNENQSPTSGVTTGTWHHAAGRYTLANERYAFINGTRNTGSPISVTVADIESVTPGTFTTFLDGSIAAAGAWSAALTDDEVKSLAKGFPPRRIRPSSLLARFPLVRTTGQHMSDCGQPSSVVGTFVTDHPKTIGAF